MEPLSFDSPAETDVVIRRFPTSAKVFVYQKFSLCKSKESDRQSLRVSIGIRPGSVMTPWPSIVYMDVVMKEISEYRDGENVRRFSEKERMEIFRPLLCRLPVLGDDLKEDLRVMTGCLNVRADKSRVLVLGEKEGRKDRCVSVSSVWEEDNWRIFRILSEWNLR